MNKGCFCCNLSDPCAGSQQHDEKTTWLKSRGGKIQVCRGRGLLLDQETAMKKGTCPHLGALGNKELEKAVKWSTVARRRSGRLGLYENPKGEGPGE